MSTPKGICANARKNVKNANLDFQLVEDHFPNTGKTAAGTPLSGADASVRHLVVERVGPKRWITERCRHAGVVDEAEFFHHEKLAVPADSQKWNADSADILHMNSSEAIDDIGLTDHFIKPVLDGGVSRPPIFWVPMALISPQNEIRKFIA